MTYLSSSPEPIAAWLLSHSGARHGDDFVTVITNNLVIQRGDSPPIVVPVTIVKALLEIKGLNDD